MKLTEKKRKNIIDAAIEEFQKHGFRGAKTTRIANKAGVSSRTLYNHFDSKEARFQEISEAMIKGKSAVVQVPFDPARDLKAQLEETLKRYVETLTEPDTIAITRMVTAEMLIDLERSKAYYAEVAKLQNPVTQLITEAMEAGAIRSANPQYASRQLISLIRDFFYTPEFMLGKSRKTTVSCQTALTYSCPTVRSTGSDRLGCRAWANIEVSQIELVGSLKAKTPKNHIKFD